MIGLYKPVALVVTFCARTSPQEMAGGHLRLLAGYDVLGRGILRRPVIGYVRVGCGPGPAPGNGRAAETS